MKAEYMNELGECEPCIILSCPIIGEMTLIELDGVRGYCSASLLEELED